jgi:predicted dehydrogenase
MNKLRVGIVGCGEVVQIIHLPSLSQLDDRFEVTALCDVSQQVLDAVGDHWNIDQRVRDYPELLALDNVDVVLVTNPNVYHAEVTIAALEAGKHVMVEKPMCLTLREADAIIEAEKKSGRTVQVAYMRRYAPSFVEACRLVRALGEIRLARVHDVIGRNHLIIDRTSTVFRAHDLPAAGAEEMKEMQQVRIQEAIGDVPPALQATYMMLLGLSSHDISAMREMLGMPQGVLYAAQRYNGRYITAAFDYGDYVCQFETGVDQLARFDACIEVYGEHQVIRVDYDTPYVRNLPIRLHVFEANPGSGLGVGQQTYTPWGDPFVAEWEAFYGSVMNTQPPKTTPADARLDLELFAQMMQCMKPR